MSAGTNGRSLSHRRLDTFASGRYSARIPAGAEAGMEQPTIKWPKGKRCAFSISFDLDGESPWIHRDAVITD